MSALSTLPTQGVDEYAETVDRVPNASFATLVDLPPLVPVDDPSALQKMREAARVAGQPLVSEMQLPSSVEGTMLAFSLHDGRIRSVIGLASEGGWSARENRLNRQYLLKYGDIPQSMRDIIATSSE